MKDRQKITVQGVVQGVGFRPFVYNLANRFGLGGQSGMTQLGSSLI